MVETQTKGRGWFRVSWKVIPFLLEKGLLLPPDYQVVEVSDSLPRIGEDSITIVVESEHIPAVGDDEALPEIVPIYAREDDQVFLDRIELTDGTVLYKREVVGNG